MNYLLDLFTPETWNAFREKGAEVTGFRERQRNLASKRVRKGDVFICYLTRLSRWCGVLQVESEIYTDDSPYFDDPDPFTVRFKVKPIVLLDPELAISVKDDEVWSTLSITKRYDKTGSQWTGFFRGSLNLFNDGDGSYLVELLKRQEANPRSDPPKPPVVPPDRESIRVQAKVAEIGAKMGFDIWVPKNDRGLVLQNVPEDTCEKFLKKLPLNYNEETLRTIEQIDVLWLEDRSMARAFEIEHTTAIYSGLLRMADLLALQPNMDIRLHIVAPTVRKERVLREITRPVFRSLRKRPLHDQCSFLSYDSINSLGETQYLSYLRDAVIAEYEETTRV